VWLHLTVQYKSWDYADAHLTDLGWQQARALGAWRRAAAAAAWQNPLCMASCTLKPPLAHTLPLAGRHITACKLPVELVVVAPLQRALETAVGAFGCHASDSCNGVGSAHTNGGDTLSHAKPRIARPPLCARLRTALTWRRSSQTARRC
jgi:hypothetical protein